MKIDNPYFAVLVVLVAIALIVAYWVPNVDDDIRRYCEGFAGICIGIFFCYMIKDIK